MLSRYKNSYLSHVILFISYYAVFSLFGSVMAVYLQGIGVPAQEAALVLSAAGIFSFFVTPITGYINDRTKSKKAVLAVMLVLIGVLGLIFSVCRQVAALFLLNGLAMSLVNSITPICERIAGDSRFRYGTLRVWGTIGYAAGAQLAGIAIDRLSGYALFVLVAVACALCLVGVAGVDMQPASLKKSPMPAEKPRLRELTENPQFFLFLLIAFLFAGCSGVNINYSPVLLSGLGVPTAVVGTVLSLSTLVEIPLILFSHKFMDKLSGKSLTALCFVLAIFQYLVYGTADSPQVVVGVMIMIKAIASTLYMMLSLKMVRCLTPVGLTTTGLSIVAAVNNLAGILLQNLAGWIVSGFGMQAVYLVMAGLCGIGLIMTVFLHVKSSQRVFG